MSPVIEAFEYLEPKTVDEAIQVLSIHGGKAKVLAGGTDLVVSLKKRRIAPRYIVNIKNIPRLDYIHYSREDGLRIGSLASHQSIAESPIVREKFGLLATACGEVGTPQVRNMGTIGGNICMAGPSQDTPPVLLALDAKLKLVSVNGERIVPVDKFFIAPFQTALDHIELLTEIQIRPLPDASGGCYKWITKMANVDETLVGVAVVVTADFARESCKDIKIGLCSVAPTPMRARYAENFLRNRKLNENLIEHAAQVAADETRPRSRADYRRRVTRVLVKRAIGETWQRIRETSA